MQHYALGFLFSKDLKKVLLIHKKRPVWQKGKINGLGGKVEKNETPQECIAREIKEEAELHTNPTDWQLAGTMHGSTFVISVFFTTYTKMFGKEKSVTDEPVAWYPVNKLPRTVISNLPWLIPLCLDRIRLGKKLLFSIAVQYDQ